MSPAEAAQNEATPKTTLQSITGISKHLCGPATDLAINCVCNFAHKHSNQSSSATQAVVGVAFALCCHHRLVWDEYCGKDFFLNTLGMFSVDLTTRCVSWVERDLIHVVLI